MTWNGEWRIERHVNAHKRSVDIEEYCTKRAPPGRTAAVTPVIVKCVSHSTCRMCCYIFIEGILICSLRFYSAFDCARRTDIHFCKVAQAVWLNV